MDEKNETKEQEQHKETKEVKSKFLRTLLRDDVYDRLELYSKSLSTGYDKWDFGVAIERLLDNAELNERIIIIEHRMEVMEDVMYDQKKTKEVKKEQEQNKEENIPLLGTHHLKVKIEEKEEN